MRIAIIGSGGVGCLYGGRLALAGHDVHFLMRRDLQAVRQSGLTVQSCDGDFHLEAQAHPRSEDIGPVDLVICALKATNLDQAEALIRPCIGPKTLVMALMNGLGVEDHFAEWFGPHRILGGLAFVCINRGKPGIIHHLGYGRLAVGHYQDDLDTAHRIAKLFKEAKFPVYVPPSLLTARWEKLVWNIPFSTLSVSAGGVSTKVIIDDPHLHAVAEHLMRETIATAKAQGCSLDPDSLIKLMFDNTAVMDHYKPSMLVDFLERRPLEVDAILGEPLRRANRLNVPVPYLAMQHALVRHLDQLNRGHVVPYDPDEPLQ
jgi:2-dehydropantoate 2-reductase